jgi:WD40 repeat protein
VFSPKGDTLAALSGESVVLWNAADGQEKGRFPVGPGGQGLAFSPRGDRLAVLFPASCLVVNVATGQSDYALKGTHTAALTGLAFVDEATVVTAGNDGRIVRWDAGAPKDLGRLPGPIRTLALAHDGRHLFTGNSNGTVSVFRLRAP